MPVRSICFVCHPFHRGGVTRWMADAALEMASRGTKTYFVTVEPRDFVSGGGSPTMISLLSGHEDERLILVSKRAGKTFELGSEVFRALTYSGLIVDQVPPETPVIVSDDKAVWLAASLISGEYPFIGVLHSDDNAYYLLAKKFGHKAAALVAVSGRVKTRAKNYVRETGEGTIPVIPCGIPLPQIEGRNHRHLLKPVLAWVGRIEEKQKRVSDITRIAESLTKQGVSFHWHIVGHGEMETELKEQLRQKALYHNFSFHGWLPAAGVLDILSGSDIFVLTSNYEGWPVAVMEALSCGCGIVSSKVSGVEDFENDRFAGRVIKLYEIGNIDAAVDQIADLIKMDPVKRRHIAREIAEKHFSIEKCMDKYEEILLDLPGSMQRRNHMHDKMNYFLHLGFSWFLAKMRLIKYRSLL